MPIETKEQIIKRCTEELETLTPREISGYAVMLSGYMFEMSEKLAHATKEYYMEWCAIKEECKTSAEAEGRAKATQAYYEKKKLGFEWESIVEIVQALKKRTQVLSDEGKGEY